MNSNKRPRALVPGSVRPGQPGNGWLRPTARQRRAGTVRDSREIAVALQR